MVFCIRNTKLKIEFSFVLMLSFALLLHNAQLGCLLLFAALHETGHLAILLLCGGVPDTLTLAFYGMGMTHHFRFSFYQELLFYLGGVLVNLILYLLGAGQEINARLFLINVLPLYPLDGGRVLQQISERFLFPVSSKILKTITAATVAVLIILSFVTKNISLILITVYVIIFALNNEG